MTVKLDRDGDEFVAELPWTKDGVVVVRLTADDARALAHAILDADRHPIEAPVLARIEIIDVAEHARQLYGGADGAAYVAGRPVPEHDYRFQDIGTADEARGRTSYHAGATATHVMASILHDRAERETGR